MKFCFSLEFLILGDSAVGKTNLLQRFVNDKFLEDSKATIGNDYFRINKEYNGEQILVKLWDTAGQERFSALTAAFYANADGALIVYDITRRASFERVSYWVNQLKMNCKKEIGFVLIGNKIDLSENRVVSSEEGADFARKHDMLFFETSAKTNPENIVQQAFDALIESRYKAKMELNQAESKSQMESIQKSVIELRERVVKDNKQQKKCCNTT